jgi:hypothetical protein
MTSSSFLLELVENQQLMTTTTDTQREAFSSTSPNFTDCSSKNKTKRMRGVEGSRPLRRTSPIVCIGMSYSSSKMITAVLEDASNNIVQTRMRG